MNTNKGFAPIIAIIIGVIIIAGGIGGYLYVKNKNNLPIVTPSNTLNTTVVTTTSTVVTTTSTVVATPSTDVTASWKTYTNTNYGFSIKYFQNLSNPQIENVPVLCTISNGVTGPIGCSFYQPNEMKYIPLYVVNFISNDKSEYNGMKISILDNKNLLSLNDWYNDYSKVMFKTIDPTPVDKRVAINIDGVSGFMMKETCCSNIDFNAYIPIGNKIIIINLNGNIELNKAEKISKDLTQILSTFKFTR